MVVYHGARGRKNLTELDPKFGQNVSAIYTATNRSAALHWTDWEDYSNKDLYPLYARIINPLIVNAKNKQFWAIDFNGATVSTENIVLYAQENGYDGAIIKNVKETDYGNVLTDDIIAFEPNQIKSTNNTGRYSLESPNIYFQADIKNLFQPVKSQLNNFREKVRNIFQGKANKQSRITVLDETPAVYQALGFDKKPLSVSYGVISKINKDKHNVSVAVVEDLPELVSDPVAIFKSKTDPDNSVVAVLDAKDADERTVVSIIRKTDGSYNVIPSVYGKDNFENFVANNVKQGNLLYMDENKAAAIRPSSLQLLGVYNDNLSKNNYITKNSIVNQSKEILTQRTQANGYYDAELKVIVLGRNMNTMTLPHELSHFWLNNTFQLFKQAQKQTKSTDKREDTFRSILMSEYRFCCRYN